MRTHALRPPGRRTGETPILPARRATYSLSAPQRQRLEPSLTTPIRRHVLPSILSFSLASHERSIYPGDRAFMHESNSIIVLLATKKLNQTQTHAFPQIGRMFCDRLVRLLTGFALGICLEFLPPILHSETASGVPGYAVTPANPEEPSASPSPPAVQAANLPGSLTVLILGDSLSLCGFGKSLDHRFRSDLLVKSTFTYMACGTVPVSWLKQKPFTNAKTYCGFWSIESVPDAAKPKEYQDTYGMGRGSRPKPHPVPKLEDLLSTIRPDILVMQTGNNILSLFRDGKTVLPARHGPIVKSLIAPFISEALKAPSTLQRIYWVASPTSGRVSKEVQDFVVEQVRSLSTGAVTLIDSRPLVSYPYRHMAPDREHFFGAQMDE